MTVNTDRLNQFVGRMLGDLGGAASVPMVRLGDTLGLYKALHEGGPMTPRELAGRTCLHERYLREWLAHNAAAGYLSYDSTNGRFELPPEQAMVFVVEDSPVNLMGAFDIMEAWHSNQAQVERSFRTGGGVPWGNLQCAACATARFFRPGYLNNLVQQWLPALDDVMGKLERGAAVADVGCGWGWSTVIMAQAFPNSRFVGYDYDAESIDHARAHAREHGVEANTRFEVGAAKDIGDGDFDLVTFFDCLHDMGDPAGAATQVRRMLKPDGTWMIVEPMAGDRLEDNLNPVGRLYYAASTLVCVPTSLSQEVGAALGAQAGEARLREVIAAGGFRTVRRAAETPFNMVLEARG
ncbi:class I SAM-dependent methyltransferase [Paracraurococcus lichenis]|uniref:Class I SAM-dependent methyltransferase n=1 Tax=Paracraurococcus lichenis TaxID=3064888 RepID=A0ABT9DWD8_9PROT|nr:class I SAM-dependent methyltransferase [Paracraurococcus sp. LOR1-02]MDO9708214.1 class I SAM-dependent methyltransferase [Paracraurococcus sp. LOR1-02]